MVVPANYQNLNASSLLMPHCVYTLSIKMDLKCLSLSFAKIALGTFSCYHNTVCLNPSLLANLFIFNIYLSCNKNPA